MAQRERLPQLVPTLKMEEGATGQGMQAAPRSWKGRENLRASRRNTALPHLTFSPDTFGFKLRMRGDLLQWLREGHAQGPLSGGFDKVGTYLRPAHGELKPLESCLL